MIFELLSQFFLWGLTLNVPEKLQLYGLHVYYVVHICDFGMLRVNSFFTVLLSAEYWCHNSV